MSTLVNLIQEEDIQALALRLQKYLKPEPIESSLVGIKETYSVKEVSKLTKRHAHTIRNHIDAGLLIAKKSGKNYIITHENLTKYIDNEK